MSTKKLTKSGRPTKLDEKTVSLLETAIQAGWSITQACYAAQISRDTYYSWYKNDQVFSDRMQQAPDHILRMAKKNVLEAVIQKDLKVSMWVMEKYTDDAFSSVTDDDMPSQRGLLFDEKILRGIQKLIIFNLKQQFIATKYSRKPGEETDKDAVFDSRQKPNLEMIKDSEILSSLDVVSKLLEPANKENTPHSF